MTKAEFDAGIESFNSYGTPDKIFARTGPGDDGVYVIACNDRMYSQKAFFQDVSYQGIIINQGKREYYLPYDSIISLGTERLTASTFAVTEKTTTFAENRADMG